MKFVKLHRNGGEVLVNMGFVTEAYNFTDENSHRKGILYFNFEVDGMQACIKVDESLDEIYEKLSGNGE